MTGSISFVLGKSAATVAVASTSRERAALLRERIATRAVNLDTLQ